MRITVIVIAFSSTLTAAAFSQGSLLKRFEQGRRANLARHDFSSPMFSTPEERAEYFGGEYRGVWEFEGDTGGGFDSNAFKDPQSLDDWRWDYSVGAAYEWWVSEESGLNITPSFGISGSRFNRYTGADSNSLGSGLSIGLLDKLPADLVLEYNGNWDFDGSFSQNVYTAHDVALSFGKKHSIGKSGAEAEWSLGGGYLFADPTDNESPHADATVAVTIPLTERLGFAVSGGMVYSNFVNTPMVSRHQWLTLVGAEFSYELGKQKEAEGDAWGHGKAIKLGILYTEAADSDSAADFTQMTVTLGISLGWEKIGFGRLFK